MAGAVVLVAAAAVAALLLGGGGSSGGSELPSPGDLPAGTVAVVVEAPQGTVTRRDFARAMEQAAAQAGLEEAPGPGDEQYGELKETALTQLLESAWLSGQASEMGISVSSQEMEDELESIKGESFKGEGEYRKFLEEARYTGADVDSKVRLQILTAKVQERLKQSVPAPSEGEVEDYYEREKAVQFTVKASPGQPGRVEPLAAVRSQIRATLAQRAEQEAFSKFVADYNRRWRSRTVCAPAYATEKCSNG